MTTDFRGFNMARSVAIQADGQIMAAGLSSTGYESFSALVRYEATAAVPFDDF